MFEALIIHSRLTEAQLRELRQIFPTVADAEIYAPNHLPTEKLDVMIYLNDTPLVSNWADKHVLYLQNSYEDSEKKIRELYSFGYDAYIFVAKNRWIFTGNTIDSPRYFCRSAWIRACFIRERMMSVLRAKLLTSAMT